MCLVCLHPENNNKSFLRYEVPDLSKEIKDLFEYRLLELSNLQLLKKNNLNFEKQKIIDQLDIYNNKIEKLKNKLSKINNSILEIEEVNEIVVIEKNLKIKYI